MSQLAAPVDWLLFAKVEVMARASIAQLKEMAANSSSPFFVPPLSIGLGGIDPLGLRQINFDLMDQVLPGLNNVARHLRPYVVATWAWHRAVVVARKEGRTFVKEDEILDFVDRIDVIYVWSQFLRNPDADLPGRQVLDRLVRAEKWNFGGQAWRAQREARRLSTALMAPINYGPALKTMGWIVRHQPHPNLFLPSAGAAPAIAALENQISHFIDEPAFSRFGPIEVATADVRSWADAWALENPTEAEQRVMREMLMGPGAPVARQRCCELILEAAATVAGPDREVDQIRAILSGSPSSNFVPPSGLKEARADWRRVQVRQLFRLALESLLYWASLQLQDGPKMTNDLVTRFIDDYARGGAISGTIDWLTPPPGAAGPTDLQDQILDALKNPAGPNLPRAIVAGLKLCLAETPDAPGPLDRSDRLPLGRAQREAETWASASTADFLRNVFEHWIFAQHVYWAVGRGLADARARGKTILRLKVVLEEDGWALAPGVDAAGRPLPSGDRLRTALTIATECGLRDRGGSASASLHAL